MTTPPRPRATFIRFFTTLVLALATCAAQAAVLVVSKTGQGTYTNIQQALYDARSGDTVLVKPGLYEESLILRAGTHLKGEDPRVTKIVSPYSDAIAFDANAAARIEGLWITCLGGSGIVLSPGTSVTVLNCIITGCRNHGIVNGNGADYALTVRHCTFAYNGLGTGSYAISVNTGGYGRVSWENCIFSENGRTHYVYTQTLAIAFNLLGETINCQIGPQDLIGDPGFIDAPAGNFALRDGSRAKNTGSPNPTLNDPDGTRCDIGAFGGPGAADFWPYPPHGPAISDVRVSPAAVPQGGKIKLNATGHARP